MQEIKTNRIYKHFKGDYYMVTILYGLDHLKCLQVL